MFFFFKWNILAFVRKFIVFIYDGKTENKLAWAHSVKDQGTFYILMLLCIENILVASSFKSTIKFVSTFYTCLQIVFFFFILTVFFCNSFYVVSYCSLFISKSLPFSMFNVNIWCALLCPDSDLRILFLFNNYIRKAYML